MTAERIGDRRSSLDAFVGGGEMGAAMRALDWTATPLGPVDTWPQSLRTAVSIILDSRFPMYIAWGREYIQFYNDAYRPILGATKHPAALGRSSAFTFAEVWDEYVGPLFDRVMSRAEPTYIDDWMLPLDRYGFVEECYFTFCYSAIRDETGNVGGILVTVVETTGRVLGARRVATLRELAATDTKLEDTAAVCASTMAVITGSRVDFPYAIIYLLDDAGERFELAGAVGVEPGDPCCPLAIPVGATNGQAPWPLARTIAARQAVVLDDVSATFGDLPGGPWPEPSRAAVVLPIALPGQDRQYGVLVAGVSPRLALDDGYRGFLDLAAGQIGRAIAGVRALEEERRRAAALAELDRAKTAFFSNVSHEFRTPLSLLLGPIEEILADRARDLDSAHRGQLEIAHRNAVRLLTLVNTLLDFSRIEAGRADASYEPVDLASLTAELASTFRSAVEAAGLTFVVDCPPAAASRRVWVDRAMWEKVVLNLISNAFKHTFDGTITVRTRAVPGGTELEVRDSGIGIPPDELPHIFERFHRVPKARSRTHEGTGIGLSLVQELVWLHGGTIAVDSQEGSGSSFRVLIPFGNEHLPPEHVAREVDPVPRRSVASAFLAEASRWSGNGAPSHVTSEPMAEPSGHILLADDNADMRAYVSRLLIDGGWSVTAVSDGAAALDAVRTEAPDLVVADVMMPGLDGFALLRALRDDADTRAIPVILLSARAGEEARVEGLDSGADDYLVKPFTARELMARVAAHVTLARARARARAEVMAAGSRLNSVFTQAPVAIAVLSGPQHVYQLANESYRRLVDDRPVVGLPIRDALPELEGQGIYELLDTVFQTQQPYVGNEIRLVVDSHIGKPEERYFNFVYQPLIADDGASEGIAVVVIDVTDLVRSRQAATSAQRDAENANLAKSQFLTAMSHELRTPLNAIAGYVQILEMGVHGPVTDAQRDALGRIQRSEQHLLALITDVLNFAKLEAGRVDYAIEPLDLAAVVADTVPIIEPQVAAKAIRFETRIDPGLMVAADGDKLRQILLNLLSNAVKFTPASGRVVVESTVRTDGDAELVKLRVSDTGIGIPSEKLDVIFDPFVQVHRDFNRVTEGTGLGLAISRDLARAMRGDITVQSVDGEGSVFTLSLRRA